MLESDLRHWIIHTLTGCDIKIQPIESPSTGNGIPDMFLRSCYVDIWMELKRIKRLSDLITIPFEPGQFSWLMNYAMLQGRALLTVAFETEQQGQCVAMFAGLQIQRWYKLDAFLRQNILCAPINRISTVTLWAALHSGVKIPSAHAQRKKKEAWHQQAKPPILP